ncbi:hypothetical protein CK203_038502 [Vitis vinifera]|uniref:Retrovirus-related Pol polyprotein from transposon TNT 1-94-like beta-barrel domain-containing protein n=1 Tax=Vitis vinifera TaxID=29760 RepID=A0A438IRS7_VITVI|nr:hypothetical protein CK203_038502 [Vitis vinifera]
MCFMAIDDLDEGSKKDKWFLDIGCSRHMTGDESKFVFLTKRKRGYVTFGDNAKGRIIGQDNIGLETSMGKLQIKDRRQQEEIVEDPKKEELPLALPPPQQVQGESSQDLPKDWKFVINHPQDQIIVTKEGTFINQAKYIRDLLKRFNMKETKTMKTLMSSSIKLDKDEKVQHQGFQFWEHFLSVRAPQSKFSFISEHIGLLGKCPAEPSQPKQTEARRKASCDDFRADLPDSSASILFTGDLWAWRTDHVQVGLRVYKAKAWPTVPGFKPREAVQRLCRLVDAQEMGEPSAHSLTVSSRVFHHMICSILLPRGGHRDEVSYFEAFIVDSILTGRRIHVGETDFEAPTSYDTYDEQSLGRMKFKKALDGSWIRRAERQAWGQGQMHPGAEEETEIRKMEDGLDPQRDFEQRGPELDIPPPP